MTPSDKNSIKDRGQCTRSTKINGGFEKITKEETLQDPTTRSKDRPKFNIMLKPFSLNPPAHKVYIKHPKAMMIVNLA